MPIEPAVYIADLVPTNPVNSDPVQQGADQLRLVKQVLVNSFPNIDGAVNATHTQINTWESRLQAVERGTPIGKVSMWFGSAAPADHLLLDGGTHNRADYPIFWSTFGPSGQNILGTGNGVTTFTVPDYRLRFPVMSGTGLALGATGGTQTPAVSVSTVGAHNHGGQTGAAGGHTHTTDVRGAHAHGGATAGHALTLGQMPNHSHTITVNDPGHSHSAGLLAMSGGGGSGTGLYVAGSFPVFENPTSRISINSASTGITASASSVGNNEAHAHSIASDGGHDHTISSVSNHTHTVSSDGEHTHTATIADGRPPFFSINFIVKAR